MTDAYNAFNVKIKNVNLDVVDAMNSAISSVSEANDDIRSANASFIQKRGFTYQGDRHQGWGLNGVNTGGYGATQYGTSLDFRGRFTLQPFGIGSHTLLNSTTPSIFGSTGSAARINRSTHIAHMKMALAVEAYKGFGIIKNVIDLMCNFSSEGLKIIHPRPAIRRFYERWAEAVNLQGRARDIYRAYYKTGNVHIYTTMGIIDDLTYNKMKNAKGISLAADTVFTPSDVPDSNDPNAKKRRKNIEKQKGKPTGKREIPWRYTILNPFQMDIRGSKFFGESEWVFLPDEETRNDIKNRMAAKNVDVLDETDINLPPEFKKLTKEGDAILLDQTKLWTMHYMKDDHEDWADPMVWPVMNDIMYKNQLRAMDMSVTNSVINAITIFKLGSIKDGFVAPPEHYKKLSEMLRTPSYSHNIVWNDAIQMESNYPPIEKILSIDKYRSVDRDILAGLGIPGILVDGSEGGSFSNAFLQVRTLLERLEEGRREVLRWINKQLRMIAEVMGHRDIPIVKFGQMSLKDEQAEKQLIIQLLDRNIISAERVHDVFDIETAIEIERMRQEKKLSEEEDIMLKFGPFKDPMNLMTQEEVMEMEFEQEDKQMKMQEKIKKEELKMRSRQQQQQLKRQQRKSVTKPNGRPSGTKGIPHKNKRTPKPKGMGLGFIRYEELKSQALSLYDKVESTITNLMLDSKGLKYRKQLSANDRVDLENLVCAVFETLPVTSEIDKEDILQSLSSIESTSSLDGLVEIMKDRNIGELSAQERREARASALALIYMENENEED